MTKHRFSESFLYHTAFTKIPWRLSLNTLFSLSFFQDNNQPFTVQHIERNFRKFGQIESIEILSSELGEAYVTFVSDLSAYIALAHSDLKSRSAPMHSFNIQPADTWIQPSVSTTECKNTTQMDDEQLPEFFMLNEFLYTRNIQILGFGFIGEFIGGL